MGAFNYSFILISEVPNRWGWFWGFVEKENGTLLVLIHFCLSVQSIESRELNKLQNEMNFFHL